MSDLEEAEATYAKATEQIKEWSRHPDSGFARQQVEMWREIQQANAWCLPGASGGGRKR